MYRYIIIIQKTTILSQPVINPDFSLKKNLCNSQCGNMLSMVTILCIFIRVAEYMLTHSAVSNPVIVGSSVHNVRIEHL